MPRVVFLNVINAKTLTYLLTDLLTSVGYIDLAVAESNLLKRSIGKLVIRCYTLPSKPPPMASRNAV